MPPRKAPPKPASAPPMAPPSRGTQTSGKTFRVASWTGAGQGEKIVGYGPSGVGKTTLFSMLPNAIFLGLDDGGRKITHPRTGEPLRAVEGVETFADLRLALAQRDLFKAGDSLVIDTFTVAEQLAEPYMFETIPHEKGGRVNSIEGYGYGKGYTHLFDTMKLVLQDCDALVRRGVNIGLICQSMAVRKANPAGVDYLYDGPKLSHPTSEKNSVRLLVCEWADHVLNINYDAQVQAGRDDKLGKAVGEVKRYVYFRPQPHFFAKSRTLNLADDQGHEVGAVTFDSPQDHSIWTFMFGE